MPKRKIIIFLVLFLVIVAIGFYLYNKSRAPKPSLVRIYTNEKVSEADSTLIEGFPNIPIYPGMRVDKTYKKEQEGKTDYVAVWYYEGGDEKIGEIMKWYIDEFKKGGWTVEGPFIDEGQNEVHINVENSQYRAQVMNSERIAEDQGGAGDIILVEILEK